MPKNRIMYKFSIVKIQFLSLLVCFSFGSCLNAQSFDISSPNQRIKLIIAVDNDITW